MFTFSDAGPEDIPVIQQIAEKTWWPTYSPILTPQQIRYMLDAIYGTKTLEEVMQNGSQKFILLRDEHGTQGFASYGPRPDDSNIFKLHKIYVLPENHGKGYGRLLIEEVRRRVSNAGSHILDLNVNRYNKARYFYEKLGFRVIREEDVPIGPYFMNDYVMRLNFDSTPAPD